MTPTIFRPFALLVALMAASSAFAQAVTLDPQGSGAISGALGWIQGTLLGSVATAVAVIAVASVGLLMLTGRMNWRFGATVVIGLFILFGAGAIVGGIRSVATEQR
ncbi:TrbC/VirB2 family protein [Glacieibacterium sp.]|uniref:TrbC/VirB2 family protein n=1 Tax=Glacieibacterium sp. TaxID=2860237 RepID=UPI003AFFFB21